MTTDLFSGDLVCPQCGYVNRGTESNIHTKIARMPHCNVIAIGDNIDADWDDVASAGYILIKNPVNKNTVSLLENWVCINCDTPFNWAKIDIIDGRFSGMQNVAISAELVKKVNYLSDACEYQLPPSAPFDSPYNEDVLLKRFIDSLPEQAPPY